MKSLKWMLPAIVALMAVEVTLSMALAAPPWSSFPLFRRVDANPAKDYSLTEEHGPWVIMCTSFSGDEAETQAKELVLELRSRYGLSAYTHRRVFDYSEGTIGRGVDRFGAPQRRKFQVDKIDEIAVLVGDFTDLDDPSAQKTLEKIKYMKPDVLDEEKRAQAGKTISRSLAAFRYAQRKVQEMAGSEMKNMGPMSHAFLATNPLLPPEYFRPKGIDQFVLKLNDKVEHSLLDCPTKYTLKIATFTGFSVIDVTEDEISTGRKRVKSQLEDAAEKAHAIVVSLRKRGVEAYEFHDRTSSIVCVGGFDSYGMPRSDGKIEINPAIHQLMELYGVPKKLVPGQSVAMVGQPKQEAGINLDVQPIIVEVPRRNVSVDYAASRFE